jgi:hypothetical protein
LAKKGRFQPAIASGRSSGRGYAARRVQCWYLDRVRDSYFVCQSRVRPWPQYFGLVRMALAAMTTSAVPPVAVGTPRRSSAPANPRSCELYRGRACPAQSTKKRLSLHWATEQKSQPFLLHSVNPSADGVRSRMVLRQPRLKPGICTRDRHHHLLSCPACPAAALLARLSIAFSQSSAACVACRPRNVLW